MLNLNTKMLVSALIWSTWVCFFIHGLDPALAQGKELSLSLSPGATFEMRLTQETQEVALQIGGNTVAIGPQVRAWRHPLLKGAITIPRAGGVTVVRLKLNRKVSVYAAQDSSPSRLRIGLGSPARNTPQVIKRLAMDFSRTPSKAGRTASVDEGQATEVSRKPRLVNTARRYQDPYLWAVEKALLKPNIAGELHPEPDLLSMSLGPNVLYAIPLPTFPLSLARWEPTFKTPASVRNFPEVSDLWELARSQEYQRAYLGARAALTEEPEGPQSDDLLYLEAALVYVDPSLAGTKWPLNPVERARYAFNRDPENPLALQTLYLAAHGYMQMGFYHEASRTLRQLVGEMPKNHPKARTTLLASGISNWNRGKTQSASADLMTALTLSKPQERDEVTLGLAATQLTMGNGPSALALLNILRDRKSKLVTTDFFQIAWADALYRSDRPKEALEVFRALRKVHVDDRFAPWIALRLGESLLLSGDFRKATAHFSNVPPVVNVQAQKQKMIDNIWALRRAQIGLLHSKGQKFDPFVLVLERLRISYPYNPVEAEALYALGKFYFKGKDFQKTIETFKVLLRRSPNFPLRNQVIAMVWSGFREELAKTFTLEDSVAALGLYEQFVPVLDAESLGDQRIFYLVAERYIHLGLYERAYRTLSQTFFASDPDPALRDRSLLLLIQTHRLMEDTEEAHNIINYARGRHASPQLSPWLDLEEGRLKLLEDDHDGASRLLASFVKAYPESAERIWASIELAQLYLETSTPKRSVSLLEGAISTAEGFYPDLAELSGPEEESQREDVKQEPNFEATPTPSFGDDIFDSLLDVHQSEALIKDGHRLASFLLGDAHGESGMLAKAAESYERAATLYPETPDANHAHFAAAQALSDLGQQEEARVIWTALAGKHTKPWSQLATEMLTHSEWESQNITP